MSDVDEIPNRKGSDHFGHWSSNAKSENDDEQTSVGAVEILGNLSQYNFVPADESDPCLKQNIYKKHDANALAQ
jgi:hypothetical protein